MLQGGSKLTFEHAFPAEFAWDTACVLVVGEGGETIEELDVDRRKLDGEHQFFSVNLPWNCLSGEGTLSFSLPGDVLVPIKGRFFIESKRP